MKYLILLFILGLTLSVNAQTYSLSGSVFDEKGKPQSFSTAVLLNPVDSTLEFYAITNTQGEFVITNVKKGDYLLQIAFMGFETIYKHVHVPLEKGNSLGTFVMKEKEVELGEVTVEGDYVPLSIKKDTIEFNAKAFKTKPGAVAEDLLKKLPGINVDRAGNIKAMGEDVSKVLVDGKEFFGNDPKVATKNLPANAINKIQLYDKKSDESEFTGIDDGVRDKTLNIKLKDDKKNAIFGDITAGYGTDEHCMGSAKAYKFTKNNQMAALGMINNINQFGFSFGDYLNFNGGIASMMHGGGSAKIEISDDNSFPVNFGQPVTGLTTSGAGGINYSHSKDENNRVFISYLGNGADKDLIRTTKTESYTQQGNYLQMTACCKTRKNFRASC
ncbi:MAG: TonB-dependent receptor [Chloroflexia bacterium]|nr:TonB-dependent receptor [Chloroflexia bacterium]